MVFSVVMLTCLVAAAGWCLLTRTAFAGWVLLAFAALWLPSNNGHLEGRNLIKLSTGHGITQGDAVGVTGWLLAMVVLLTWALRSGRGHVRSERVGAVMLIGLTALALGALTAYETG
ncbi:MAG TPA: hypothetical protein VGN35_12900 [Jatrophihabitantaceae bacterium]|jgi:hypothetical protein|nr:hypothetical protein [Jatrophihabitantaceae bacterium]